MHETVRMSAGARMDGVRVGGFHYHVLFLIGMGMFLDAFDIYLAGGVLGSLLKSGWSTLELNALFVSLTFVGMMIGALTAGILGDRFGRRFSCQINLAIFGLASLAAALAPNMMALIACRFVIGIGLGAEVAVGFAIVSEFMPARSRGRWIAATSVVANAALFVSSIVGLAIIPNFGWRPMFLIVAVGAAILAWFRRKMPESPRWLERKGRHDEANVVLNHIESTCRKDEDAPAPTAAVPITTAARSILVLFRREVVARTILAMVFNMTLGISLYGLITWLPTFFVREGLSIASSLGFTTVMSLGGPTGALIGMLLADKVPRRRALIIVPLISATLALIYPEVHDPTFLLPLGFLMVTTIYVWVTFGNVVTTEMFDTEYRLRGTGFGGMTGRLTTAIIQFPIIALFQWGGVLAVVGAVAVMQVLLSLLFLAMGIETRQKPLEALAPTLT